MSDSDFADDVPWVKFKCLEIAKEVGKNPRDIISAAKQYEKYILPKAVRLELKTGEKSNEKVNHHKQKD